jgi:DNA polymerase I
MKKILIIDGNATAHRAKHTTGTMKYGGEYTGTIYGFFTQLFTMLKKYRPDLIAFAWDSKTSLRKKIYPEYKAKRAQAKKQKSADEIVFDQACYEQFYEIQEEILPAIGIVNNFKASGYEGDDIIASICKHNAGHKIIATSDNDMFQLLSDEVSIYDLRNKTDFTAKDFMQVYHISPAQWADVKILAGCDGDGVSGIQGVGIETAIKFIQGLLKPGYKTYTKIISDESAEIKAMNKRLVVLPFKGTPIIKLVPQYQLDLQKMKSLFMDYGFRSLCDKEKFDEWKILLKGEK